MKNSKNKTNNQKQIMWISILVLAVVVIAAVIAWMNTNDNTPTKSDSQQNTPLPQQTHVETDYSFLEGIDTTGSKNVRVVINDGQSLVITVLPAVAPETAANFISLVESGFYDGLTFHRVIKNFMAQGGDPEGTGFGGAAKTIRGEFAANGFDNRLPHKRSVVSMARSNDFDSASSQFFICYDSAPHLDGQYAAFGYVSEGMEVVDSFLSAGTDESDRPLKDVIIKSMTIE